MIPDAAHDHFTDGPLFKPTILPWSRAGGDVITVSRGAVLAFFKHTIGRASTDVFKQIEAPTDVYVNVYPLGDRRRIP